MKLTNERLLRTIFACKGNLRLGNACALSGRKEVRISPFKNRASAAVSISADLEMAWAWRSRSESEFASKAATERKNVPRILEILETFNVPITWATVGHLFLESCGRGRCGRAHPDMPRPPRNDRWPGDWYLHDPCSNSKQAPDWYAPDLISRILSSPVKHELGTHSFSHIDFSLSTSTAELVEKEITACIEAMAPFGARPRSLVFCHNHMGHHHSDLLYDLGIFAVRHRDARIRLAYPERTASGVYRVVESMNLRLARYYHYREKAKIFIDEAIRRGAAYHLWFHPSDERKVFEEAFLPIIEYIDQCRRKGLVWVATMADLAAYCEARERTTVRSQLSGNHLALDFESTLDTARFGNPEITLEIEVNRPVKAVIIKGLDGAPDRDATFEVRNHVGAQRLIVNVPCQSRHAEICLA